MHIMNAKWEFVIINYTLRVPTDLNWLHINIIGLILYSKYKQVLIAIGIGK